MKKILLALVLAIATPAPVLAQMLWGGIRLGMTVEQLQRTYPESTTRESSYGSSLVHEFPSNVGSIPVLAGVESQDGRVVSVTLSGEGGADIHAELRSALHRRYGTAASTTARMTTWRTNGIRVRYTRYGERFTIAYLRPGRDPASDL